jgi:hypothetical protein
MTEAGAVKFYVDAEAVLERLPRLGVPLILKARRRDGAVGSYRPNHMAKLVRKLADKFGMPATFTLDACRHGGMTELEEAELTTGPGWAGPGRAGQGRAGQGRAGQGRALSGHRTDRAYSGYAKATMERALAATRKRHAHRLANENSTSVQNGRKNMIQNGNGNNEAAIA